MKRARVDSRANICYMTLSKPHCSIQLRFKKRGYRRVAAAIRRKPTLPRAVIAAR